MEGINMKKLLKASLTVMMALTLSACGGSKDVNIGIVQYAEHPALDNAKKGFLMDQIVQPLLINLLTITLT